MRSGKHNPLVGELLERIRRMDVGRVRLMEVCGTHTMSIARSGIKNLLPENIELISGPGCPVCVTPASVIDLILRLSMESGVIIASYGDMLRVPGSLPGDNLLKRRANGAQIEIVYSPMDALEIAEKHPDCQVVFLGVGFETTAPGTAATILSASARGISNFSMLSMLKRVEPALRALIPEPGFDVQGFLCPGHVASVTGESGFRFLAEEYGIPAVISGFEPEEILAAVYRLLRQIEKKAPRLENAYSRAVSREGNADAKQILSRCLIPRDELWRGLGVIPESGLGIRKEYAAFDAQARFGIRFPEREASTACRCGDIIRGKTPPQACPLFAKRCVPEDPVGPCMVSSEGACAAAYKYGDIQLCKK